MNSLERKRLNSYQKEAVLDESPACLVNANVGSGKTTVLTEKVRYLHEERFVPYEKMMVLTFTNKAADEIVERLGIMNLEENVRKQLWGFGTFHGVARQLLCKYLPEKCTDEDTDETVNQNETTGWNREFEVIEPEEELQMLFDLADANGYKIKYKNRLQARLENDYEAYLQGKPKGKYKDDLFRVFPLLDRKKRQENKMSFADLIREGTKCAEEHKKDLGLQWIIVDEVQDSDQKQLDFIEALKDAQTRFFAVGDPNQVIYSWRGTAPNMFFMIKHRFEAKELSLPVNYRSSDVILEAANRFLQFGGKIEGNGIKGDKILIKNHYDPFIEAEYLTERIRKLHEDGLHYSQIAVFYRVQKQAEILEKVFERAELPFTFSNVGKEGEVIHFMTLHASKGLEFDYVFIVGLNQGLIPLRCTGMEQEEEEMRLFFVGLTRARKNLELSYYTNPTIPGVFEAPSRYLKRLPEHLLDWKEKPGSEERKANLQSLRRQAVETIRRKSAERKLSVEEENLAEIKPVKQGKIKTNTEPVKQEERHTNTEERVVRRGRHPKYGEGIITSEDDMMIEVEFPGYGKKQFLKAFGEIEVL